MPLLEAVGADPKALRRRAEEQIAALPKAAGSTVGAPQTSRPLLVVLNTAANRAKQLEDDYVSTEHLLVGLAADGGPVATLLTRDRRDARTRCSTRSRRSAGTPA